MDPLSLATGGLGALGGLFSGLTSLFGGNAQATALRYQAQEADMNAGSQAQEALISGNRTAASAAARAAANGGGFVGGGSSLGVISDLSDQATMNARSAIYKGQTQAQSDLYQASVASTQGKLGLVSGIIGGGSSLLGGFMRSSLIQQLQNPWGGSNAASNEDWDT